MLVRALRSIRDFIEAKENPVEYAKRIGVELGHDVRLISIKPGMGTFGSEPYLIRIGNHVTIAGGVQFVTHDGGVRIFRDKEPDIDVFGPIVIGDNVFVGYGAILMPGITIGSNTVIGAGAVVTRDVPANSVAVGCPAKVLCSINEYYQSIKGKKENIRNLSAQEKADYLKKKYM